MCDGALGVGCGVVENVGCAAVCHELAVHGEVDIVDGAVGAKDFAEVSFVHVFGEFFDDDLQIQYLLILAFLYKGRVWGV